MFRKLVIYMVLMASVHLTFSAFAKPPFEKTLVDIEKAMQTYHYSPQELNSPEYKKMQAKMRALAESATSKKEFIDGFNHMWWEGPFSHVRIDEANQSAEALAEFLDKMNVGGNGAILTWEGNVAVLTVNTMMGQDTIKQIDAAYDEINQMNAAALIIDLRQNNGGAFAVKPLVSHLIESPIDSGVFVSQAWNANNSNPPTAKDMKELAAWEGWSIKAFWEDAQNNNITRIQFQPATPYFGGRVFVLISKTTASAGELAADALLALPNATLIGETTAGEMLSQKMYDVAGGFQIFLPIADYYSVNSGRIEGNGVKPHISVPSTDAMDVALSTITDCCLNQ
ncbi:hypothetical protein DXV75_11205 [Alteromonas aestuariivivens]|uniref:Tail specific protease domain-containing protein n=1 Tax=Alteromonas aestuariivivens TaxID=1938339 RepID=A0A3D8M688_9ALTE|nr:S41 family peptidase [Alteromonas aestuariivivens]RDV25176.1 hypothetical protein DXV75_11205 [Alteromonas aestuariivivens]